MYVRDILGVLPPRHAWNPNIRKSSETWVTLTGRPWYLEANRAQWREYEPPRPRDMALRAAAITLSAPSSWIYVLKNVVNGVETISS